MSTPVPDPTPAELDTTAAAPSGGPEPVRDLGEVATRLLNEQARLVAAFVGVIVGVGSLLVLGGLVTAEDVTRWATGVGVALTSVGAFLAVLLPLLKARSAGRIVHGQAEVVRGEVVPVEKVAAYSPAADDVDIALGPAAGVLDAYDTEQP